MFSRLKDGGATIPRAQFEPLESRVLLSIVPAGSILVADNSALGGKGAIFAVAADGTKTVIASGAPFVDPSGIVEDVQGNLFVVDPNAGVKRRGAIFRIDGQTGAVTIVSQFSPADGTLFLDPTGIALGANGQLYVADSNAGPHRGGAIIKVDPTTGVQTLISEDGPDFGTSLVDPTGIAVNSNGNLIVADPNATPSGNGAILLINATTGVQNVISKDNIGLGDHLHNPMGVAIQSNGTILIVDKTTGYKNRGALVQINPLTGLQTEIANSGNFRHPTGVAIAPDGSIYVTQPQGFNGRGGVIKVSSKGAQQKTFTGKPFAQPFGVLFAHDLRVASTKIPDQAGIAGTPFSLNLSTFFTEADGTSNLTISATLSGGNPLPAWLSVDSNGVLSGNPPTGGKFTIVATAIDPASQSSSRTFNINVTGPQAATIVLPPPMVIQENGSGTLNVTASTTDNLSLVSQFALSGFPAGWTVNLANLNSNPIVQSAVFAGGTLTIVVKPAFSVSLPITMSPPVHNEFPFTLSVSANTIRDTGLTTATALTTVIVDAVAATPTVGISFSPGANFVVPVVVNANFNYPLDYTETDTVVVTLPTGIGIVSTPSGGVFNAGTNTITFAQPLGATTFNTTFNVILPLEIISAPAITATATVVKQNTTALDTDHLDKTASATAMGNISDDEAATFINSGIGHDDPAVADVTSALDDAKLKLAAMGATSPLSANLLAFIQSIDNQLADPSFSTAQAIPILSAMIGGSASGLMERLGAEAAKLDGNSLLSNFDNIVVQPQGLGEMQAVNLGSGLAGISFNQFTYPGHTIGFPDQSDGTYVGPATASANVVTFVINGTNFASPALLSTIVGGGAVTFVAGNGDSITVVNDSNPITTDFADALAAKINANVTSSTYFQLDPTTLAYTGDNVISFSGTPAAFPGTTVSVTDTAGEVFSIDGLAFPIAPGTPIVLTSTTRAGVTLTVKTGIAPINSAGELAGDLNLFLGSAGAQLTPSLDRRITAVLQSVGGNASDNLQDEINQLMTQTQANTNSGGIFDPTAFAAVNQASDLSDRLTAFLSLFDSSQFTDLAGNTITISLTGTAPTTLDGLLQEMSDPLAPHVAPSLAASPTASLGDISTVVDNGIGHDDPAIATLTDALNAAKVKLIALGSNNSLANSLLAFIQSIDNALSGAGVSTAQQIPTLLNMLSSTSSSSVMAALQADGAMLDGSNLLSSTHDVVIQPANLGTVLVNNLGSGLASMTFNQLTYPGIPIGFADDANGNYTGPASVAAGGAVSVNLAGEVFTSSPLLSTIPAGGSVTFAAAGGDSFTLVNDANAITSDFADAFATKINQNITSNTYINLSSTSVAYNGNQTITFAATPASADISGDVTLTATGGQTYTAAGLAFPIAAGASISFVSTSDATVSITVQNGTTPITSSADLVNRLNVMFINGTQLATSLDGKLNTSLQQLMGTTGGNVQTAVANIASQLQFTTNPNNIFDPTAFAAATQATSLSGQLNAFLSLFSTTNCPQGTITITLGATPPTTLQGLLNMMS